MQFVDPVSSHLGFANPFPNRGASPFGVSVARNAEVVGFVGNRDADALENPDVFDIDRNPHHVAFGIGNHFCLGANLARMEMRVALNELLRRMPDIAYAASGPEMGSSALVRSVQHMHVKFTPESAA